MSRRQDCLKQAAPRSPSHVKYIDEIQILNDLVANLAVSDAELAALEMLIGWEWLNQFLQNCGGSEPDI